MKTYWLLWLHFLTVVFIPKGGSTGSRIGWNFAKLWELKNDTEAFKEEAQKLFPKDAPSLQELTDMVNTLSTGNIPSFITNNNYTSMFSSVANYSYGYGNIGIANSTLYGLFKTDGYTGAYSSLKFEFAEGSVGTFNYQAGNCYFTQVFYIKGETYVNFQASMRGVVSLKNNGTYAHHGNYTRVSQGNMMEFGEVVKDEMKALGILHNPQYHALDEITKTGKSEGGNYTTDIVAIGVTNGTYTYFISPNSKISVYSGILRNERYESTLEAYSVFDSCFGVNSTDPFDDCSLALLFATGQLGVDVLPDNF